MRRQQVIQPVSVATRTGCVPGFGATVRLCLAVVTLTGLSPCADPAAATTLRQAMAEAYRSNPRLDAERARLRATDEEVPRARAGWRPQITGSSDYGYNSTKTSPRTSIYGKTHSWGYSVNVQQPIFSGFRTVNGVRQAEAGVRAGRENLRLIEQQVLLQAVSAYADVLRDEAVLRLRRHNVEVLTRDLTVARARRRVREITRTDVAQSRARRARGVSQLDAARANLKASRAKYKQIVGRPPAHLARASYRSRLLPSSLRQALAIAEREHPNIISAKYREQAARSGVDRVRGELLPDVRLEASYSRRHDGSVSIHDQEDARITGRVTVPFYKGGEVYARLRQAKHTHVSRLQEIEQARQEVEAGIIAAWSQLAAARSRLNSDHVQLAAARTALEGVREEEKVGQRTIIELLNAEQELLDAGVAVEVTRRDLTVAAYTMIAAMGRLSAERLALMEEVYDPQEHYSEVREKWLGTSITQPAQADPIHEETRFLLGRHSIKTRRRRRAARFRRKGVRLGQRRPRRASAKRQSGKQQRAKQQSGRKKAGMAMAAIKEPRHSDELANPIAGAVLDAAAKAAQKALAKASYRSAKVAVSIPLPVRPARARKRPFASGPSKLLRGAAAMHLPGTAVRVGNEKRRRGRLLQQRGSLPAPERRQFKAQAKALAYVNVTTQSISRDDRVAGVAAAGRRHGQGQGLRQGLLRHQHQHQHRDGGLAGLSATGLRGAMIGDAADDRHQAGLASTTAPNLALPDLAARERKAGFAVIRGARVD